jgi:hypothetical protein
MENMGYGAYQPTGDPWRQRAGKRVQIFAAIVAVGFAIAAGAVVAQRLSDEAMAVLAGTVCGVAASIPTSLLIVMVTRRREERSAAVPGVYPPVVVVQPPPQPPATPGQQLQYLSPYAPPAQREFSIVGGEMEEVRYGHYQ